MELKKEIAKEVESAMYDFDFQEYSCNPESIKAKESLVYIKDRLKIFDLNTLNEIFNKMVKNDFYINSYNGLKEIWFQRVFKEINSHNPRDIIAFMDKNFRESSFEKDFYLYIADDFVHTYMNLEEQYFFVKNNFIGKKSKILKKIYRLGGVHRNPELFIDSGKQLILNKISDKRIRPIHMNNYFIHKYESVSSFVADKGLVLKEVSCDLKTLRREIGFTKKHIRELFNRSVFIDPNKMSLFTLNLSISYSFSLQEKERYVSNISFRKTICVSGEISCEPNFVSDIRGRFGEIEFSAEYDNLLLYNLVSYNDRCFFIESLYGSGESQDSYFNKKQERIWKKKISKEEYEKIKRYGLNNLNTSFFEEEIRHFSKVDTLPKFIFNFSFNRFPFDSNLKDLKKDYLILFQK